MKRNKKKYVKSTIVSALVVSAVAPMATQASSQFSDVKASEYYYDAVLQLAERGIINGFNDGTFKPNESVTRGQAAKIIAGILELDTKNVTNPNFKDVSKSNPYYGAIAALANAGIINGYEDSTFRPNAAVQRNHMAKIISLAFNLTIPEGFKNPFTDVKGEYKQYVTALYAAGVTTGRTATTFDGISNVTRGQLATFVIRAEKKTEVDTKEVTFTISQVQDHKVEGYIIPQALKGLLNEANNAALEGAVVNATLKGDEIVAIHSLQLNAPGTAETLVTLDGGQATIEGNLLVNADNVEVKNVSVQGNVSLTSSVKTAFSADGLINNGEFIVEDENGLVASVTPIFANVTNGPKIGFKNSHVNSVQVKRDNVAIASDVKLPEVTVSSTVSTIQVDADVAKLKVDVTVNIAISGTGSFDEVALEKAVEVALNIVGTIAKLAVNSADAKVEVATSIKVGEVTLPANTTASGIIKNYESIKNNISNVVSDNTTITPPPTSGGSSSTGGGSGSGSVGGGSGGGGSNPGVDTAVTVTNVSPISETVVVGKSYTLPKTVTVTLSNGRTEQRAVTWTAPAGQEIVDGTVTFKEYIKDAIFIGSVAGTSKEASLKLTAITEVEAKAVEDLIKEVEILEGEIKGKVEEANQLIIQIKEAEVGLLTPFNQNIRLSTNASLQANSSASVDVLKEKLGKLLGEIVAKTNELNSKLGTLAKLELNQAQKAKVAAASTVVTDAETVEGAAGEVGVKPDGDQTPPTFDMPNFGVTNIGTSFLDLSVKVNENAIGYYVLIPYDEQVSYDEQVPTPTQVKQGKDISNNAAFKSGSFTLNSNEKKTVKIDGLTASTKYILVMFVEDIYGNKTALNLFTPTTESVDQTAVTKVDGLIEALPEAGTVTLADKADIEVARAAYDALTPAQQALVKEVNVTALEAAEAELAAELINGETVDVANGKAADKAAVLEAIKALASENVLVQGLEEEAIEIADGKATVTLKAESTEGAGDAVTATVTINELPFKVSIEEDIITLTFSESVNPALISSTIESVKGEVSVNEDQKVVTITFTEGTITSEITTIDVVVKEGVDSTSTTYKLTKKGEDWVVTVTPQ